MRLYLIRHGLTHSNLKGLLDTGAPGADLTDLGQQQAAALAERLAGEPIEALYVSNLVRTHQTAAPLAAALGLEPVQREGLREVRAGDLEMAGDETSTTRYLSTVTSWCQGDHTPQLPGGERASDVLARFDAVVQELRDDGHRTAAIVSHGAMIRTWASNRATNLPDGFAGTHVLKNTEAAVLEEEDGGWVLRLWAQITVG